MKAAARGTRQAHEVTRRASVAGWCLNSAKKMVPRTATPSEVDNCCEASIILAAQVTYAAIEAELRRADPSALAAEITANFARLPADDFPLITAHTAQLVAGDVDERFRFAIDVVIDGVLGRASRR
jgi:hypothetical protein